MRKYLSSLQGRFSNGFTSLSNYLKRHTSCMVLWIFSLLVAFTLYFVSELEHTAEEFQSYKKFMILEQEHQLLGKDFMQGINKIQLQNDTIDEMREYIGEASTVIQLQNKAIRQLQEELRKAKGGNPSRSDASFYEGVKGKKG